jgi:hypothetical protein
MLEEDDNRQAIPAHSERDQCCTPTGSPQPLSPAEQMRVLAVALRVKLIRAGLPPDFVTLRRTTAKADRTSDAESTRRLRDAA